MTAFLNDGATPSAPVIESISSVAISALMRQAATACLTAPRRTA